LGKWKNSVTSSGIEPATFGFVATVPQPYACLGRLEKGFLNVERIAREMGLWIDEGKPKYMEVIT
jgi:hypothetical protein